jgi:uncharacterized protein (TIGR03437 family)
MFRLFAQKIALAASALLLCAGIALAQTPSPSPLISSSPSVSISFSLPSTIGAAQTISLTVASGTVPFVVDPTTVPFWLSVTPAGNATSVTAGTPLTVSFVATSAAGTLPAGAYATSVGFAVNGYAELTVPVTLTVSGAASTLSVNWVYNGTSTAITSNQVATPILWAYGSATLPSVTLNLVSSNDPITFSSSSAVTTNGPEDWIQLPSPNGIAYNYGTGLTVNFAKDALANATVGSTMTGTVTITYGTSTFVVNIAIEVTEPAAAVSSIFPQETPALTSGTLTVVVNGSGLGGTNQGYTHQTTVSLTYGPSGASSGTLGAGNLTGGSVSYLNTNTMVLTIPYQDTAGVSILGQTVSLSISNPTINTTPATATLFVTSNPIIYSVTDAAALQENEPGTATNVAPYELVTIFGNNFCPTCTAPVSAPVTNNRYPTSLVAPAGGSNTLTVTFYKGGGTGLSGLTSPISGYIVFASNTQINALVPSNIGTLTAPMQVVVAYGPTSGSQTPSNDNVAYLVAPVLANPGIFTTSSSGQGQGAILNQDGTVNSSSNKETPGSVISIYASGLGTPDSTAAYAAAKAAAFPTTCISVQNYVTAAALSSPATPDGAIIETSLLTPDNLYAPCFSTTNQITVTIGGSAATLKYAGWVAGSVAGLYQINVAVPTKTTPTSGNLPVVVTVTNGKTVNTSQAGVTVAVN